MPGQRGPVSTRAGACCARTWSAGVRGNRVQIGRPSIRTCASTTDLDCVCECEVSVPCARRESSEPRCSLAAACLVVDVDVDCWWCCVHMSARAMMMTIEFQSRTGPGRAPADRTMKRERDDDPFFSCLAVASGRIPRYGDNTRPARTETVH